MDLIPTYTLQFVFETKETFEEPKGSYGTWSTAKRELREKLCESIDKARKSAGLNFTKQLARREMKEYISKDNVRIHDVSYSTFYFTTKDTMASFPKVKIIPYNDVIYFTDKAELDLFMLLLETPTSDIFWIKREIKEIKDWVPYYASR
jgi:hypothetical protein